MFQLSEAIANLNKRFKQVPVERRPLADWLHTKVFYKGKVASKAGDRLCLRNVEVWRWGDESVRTFDHIWLTYPEGSQDLAKIKPSTKPVVGLGKVYRYTRNDDTIDYGILPRTHVPIEMLYEEFHKADTPSEAIVVLKKFLKAYDSKNLLVLPGDFTLVAKIRQHILDEVERLENQERIEYAYKMAARVQQVIRKKASKHDWRTLNHARTRTVY